MLPQTRRANKYALLGLKDLLQTTSNKQHVLNIMNSTRLFSSTTINVHQQQQGVSSSSGDDISKCPYHQQQGKPTVAEIKSFNEIPGPKELPLVGNLFDVMKGIKKNASPFFASLAEQYGEVVKLNIMGKKMLLISNPTDMEFLYKNEERRQIVHPSRKYKTERGLPLTPIEMYLHEPWNETRQLYNIAMKPDFQDQVTLPQLTEINGEYIRRIIKYLQESEDPEKYRLVDGVSAVSRYGFDAVLKVFLGAKLTDEVTDTFPFDVADFVKVSTEFLDIAIRLISKPSVYKYFKTAEYKQMENAMDKSLEYGNYVMDRFKNNPSDKPRFYEILMERSKNEPNQMALVQSVMITFLQAAIDITMRMLVMTMYRLAHSPEYQEKVYQECLEIFGEPTLDEVTSENGLEVTKEQYKKLKVTKNFMEEVLRVNPFAFLAGSRILSDDLVIAGYNVPKDTTVIVVQKYANTRDEFVPRANEFIPERHEKGSPLGLSNNYISTPFGIGARKCPGSRIALHELHLAIINTVRHFKLSHSNPETFPPTSFDQALLYIDLEKNPLYFTPRDHLKEHFYSLKQKKNE